MLEKFQQIPGAFVPGVALMLIGIGFAVVATGMLIFGFILRVLMKVYGVG